MDLLEYSQVMEAIGAPGSQRRRLMEYLWSAGSMTHFDAEEKCGKPPITTIRSRVPEMNAILRPLGWYVEARLEPNEFKGQHARYYLVKLMTDEQRWRQRIGVGKAV